MKIAIVGQTLNTNHRSKISGGIQTVERLHARIFLEQGHEVFFITTNDSELFNDHPSFHLCKMWESSLEHHERQGTLSRADKSRINKALSSEIRSFIAEIQPDLVINHSFSSSHVRLAAELSARLPVACFIHNTPDTAMDIGVIAKVQHYQKLTENGGALVCVSRYQRDLWRSALRQRVENGSSFSFLTPEIIDKIYDRYCYPVYVEEPSQPITQDTADHFIVITRPDPIKNLHKLLDLATRVKPFKLVIYLAHPTALEENEYYVEKIAPKLKELRTLGFDVEVYHNALRHDVLADLSTARGCFIPCTVEAAPVVLLEAGSLGVRSIVFARSKRGALDHAALDLVGRDHLELVDISGTADEAASGLSLSVERLRRDPGYRKTLSELVIDKHSFLKRTCDIMSLMSDLQRKPVRRQLWD